MAIAIPGLGSNNNLPGSYIQLNLGAGGNPGTVGNKILLLGMKTASGTATADSVIYGPDLADGGGLNSVNDAQTLFGIGSELALMYDAATKANGGTNAIYAVAETAAGVAATGTITIAGTSTGSGSVKVWVSDVAVEVVFSITSTPTSIALDICSEINRKQTIVTAAPVAGVITLTHRHLGIRGNYVLYKTLSSGQGVTSVAAGINLTGGTGSPDLTTILSTIANEEWFYVIAADGYGDSTVSSGTSLGALAAFITTQAAPTVGFFQRLMIGYTGALANVATFTAALGNKRMECFYLRDANEIPGVLAAKVGAFIAAGESLEVPEVNFQFSGASGDDLGWFVQAPSIKGKSAKETTGNYATLANSGVSILRPDFDSNKSILVQRNTTYYKLGSDVDLRARNPHKCTVSDLFCRELKQALNLSLRKNKIGNVPAAGSPTPRNTVTAETVKRLIKSQMLKYTDILVILENYATMADSIVVARSDSGAGNSFEVQFILDVCDIMNQYKVIVNQTS